MITFTNTIDITRPINDVYEYLADLRNVPEWNWAIESTEPTSESPIRVGSTFRQIRHTPTRSIEELQITELRQDERIVVSGQLGSFNARIVYNLSPSHDGTTIENTMALEATGPTQILASLMGPRVSRSVASNLANLKKVLESQTPIDHATPSSQHLV
jgi:uncharacterized membrane protein